MYKNLSDFIARLEAEGELVRVRAEVSPVEEIAELTDRMSKAPGGGKALLFERTGTEFPVVTNLMGSPRRMAMALGTERLEALGERVGALLRDAAAPRSTLRDKLRALPLAAEMSRWFPRRTAGRGACQEVVWRGDEARLSRLPVLGCWPADGGRFVTLPVVHTVDPDTGIPNAGMYRMQLLDDRTTAMHWHIHKTGARHFEAYRRRGERMPVTVTLGGDPACIYAATAPMPDNMDEYLLAGFLRRRPVRLVRSLTNGLLIPADCDFVLEGYVDPAEEPVTEGPFGDHTGFYSLEERYPRFHVTAVTHRRGAVWPATLVGIPPMEDRYLAEATERIFLAPIRLAVQPEVRDLWMPPAGTAHNLAVVSIERRYAGQAHKVAQALWGAGQMMFNKYLVVAPAETDIRDLGALARAVRRFDPGRGLIRSEGVLDVLDHATATNGFGGKAAFDLAQCGDEPCPGLPARWRYVGGIEGADTSLVAEWSALQLFAPREAGRPDVGAFAGANALRGVKYAILFDLEARDATTPFDRVWLAAANTDPRRDLWCEAGILWLDARSKRPGMPGNPDRFPNPPTSRPETIARVDARWEEYGVGERLPSPSERYRALRLSDQAAW